MANKQDLEGAMSGEEAEEYLEVEVLRRNGRRVRVFGTSAVTGRGLREAMGWVEMCRKCGDRS